MKFKTYLTEAKKLTINQGIRNKINKDISKLMKPTYFKNIPLQSIFDVLKKYEIVPLQEDNTYWEGLLIGGVDKTEQVYFDLGWESTESNGRYAKVTNASLALSYYKMASGKYEVISYLT